MKNPDSMEKLFQETPEAFARARPDVPIFIKPHAVTDEELLRSAVKYINGLEIIITGLHPSILATRARFLLAIITATLFMTLTFLACQPSSIPSTQMKS